MTEGTMHEQATPSGRWCRNPRLVIAVGACGLLLYAVWFGFHAHHAAHNLPEVEVAEEIVAAEGGYGRESIAPNLCGLTDGSLRMDYGPITCVLYRTPITDAKMAPLVKLGHLEEFTVIPPRDEKGWPITNRVIPSDPAVWRWLAELTTLREVCIMYTDIRDDDLVHMYNLPRLRRIDLWKNPNLTLAGVDRLRRAQPNVHINY